MLKGRVLFFNHSLLVPLQCHVQLKWVDIYHKESTKNQPNCESIRIVVNQNCCSFIVPNRGKQVKLSVFCCFVLKAEEGRRW